MTINYPGPYEILVRYTPLPAVAPVLQHRHRVNISLVEPAAQGDVFGNYDINDKAGPTTVDLATVVEDWLTRFNALFAATMTIDTVELWKYPTAQSFDAIFWSSYTPAAAAGTGAGSNQPATQDIFTFRSVEGGVMKLSLMEDRATPGLAQAYASMPAEAQDVVDFILDGDSATYTAPFLARDTSYPFTVIKRFPGQNEAVWKKRNRA